MRWSMRYQVMLPLGWLLAGIVGISAWTAHDAASQERQTIAARVDGTAQALHDAQFPLTPKVLEQMKELSGAEYLLVDGDGRRVTTLDPDPSERIEEFQPDDGLLSRPTLHTRTDAYYVRPVGLSARNAGATLFILYPESRLRAAQWAVIRPTLILGSLCGLLATVLTLAVGRRMVGRVRELEQQTRRIASGDFSPMPLPQSNDELQDLSRSVNDMAQRLEQMHAAMQRTERLRLLGQVSGGLAHQLRNAVTGARLAVQVHARHCSASDREALDVALRQLTLMEASLRRFLDLGRPDSGRRDVCSLTALIDEAVALLTPQCQHLGTTLHWQPSEDSVLVHGDAGQLGQVVLNVVSNAVEAAGPQGWIRIHIRSDAEWHHLEVHDSGPGPPADVADRLFEPFVTGKPDGVGLGLAVARQSVESHGGRMDWQRKENVTVFRITLPCQAKRPSSNGEPTA